VRDNILFKDNMLEIVYPMVENEAKRVIEAHCPEHVIPENWDLDALQKEFNRVIAHFGSINEKMLDVSDIQDLVSDRLHEYKTRLEMKAEDESFQQFLKFILLTTIDDQWMNHLEKMEELKEGIGLRGYGQMDPIIMYEKEGFDVFKETFETIEKMIAIQLTKYVETNWGLDEGENRDEK
jgi:preprotein translocase subunit SecA